MLSTEIIRETAQGRKRVSEIDDGAQWYADMKHRMKKERRFADFIVLSPSRAAALLNVNEHNRPISDNAVSILASDISNNRWQFNGEPIILSETGELNDGQHRCQAVIIAGKAIEVVLVAGVTRKSRFTVDMGGIRTVGNFLGMHGIPDPNNVAAVAAIMHAFETNGVANLGTRSSGDIHKRTMKPTKAELRLYAESHLDEIKRAMSAFSYKDSKTLTTWTRVCGIAIVISRKCKDWTGTELFFSKLLSGAELKRTDPVFVARERIINERNEGTLTAFRFFEIVIRAWNAHRGGQQSKIIKVLGVLPDIAR